MQFPVRDGNAPLLHQFNSVNGQDFTLSVDQISRSLAPIQFILFGRGIQSLFQGVPFLAGRALPGPFGALYPTIPATKNAFGFGHELRIYGIP